MKHLRFLKNVRACSNCVFYIMLYICEQITKLQTTACKPRIVRDGEVFKNALLD